MLPSAIMLPFAIIMVRGHISHAKSRSCVAMMQVCENDLMRLIRFRRDFESRFAVGSSITIILGSIASTVAMAI